MPQAQELFEKAKKLFDKNTYDSRAEAIGIFLDAAELDSDLGEIYSKSYYFAGQCYEKNNDKVNALKLYKKAYKSAQPYKNVFCELGRYYYFGYETEVDYKKAYDYFCHGLSLGYTFTHYYIGLCHLRQRIENYDDSEAFKHLSLAYEDGVQVSAPLLAECYEKGIGTAVDLDAAVRVLEKYPKKSQYVNKAGEYLIKLERFNEAKAHFGKVLEIEKEGTDLAQKAQKSIEKIHNVLMPQKIEKLLVSSGVAFSEIEAVINNYSDVNSEALYDLALEKEKNNELLTAVKLLVVAAANGCRKAQYTLSNMAADNTRYFTEIIEHGVRK